MRSSFLQCFLLSALLIQVISCAEAPRSLIIEHPLSLDASNARCLTPFLHGNWQMVHSIQADLAGGPRVTMIGVTALDSWTKAVDCVLMTLEGMVLFDARYDGEIHIRRSLPPFDSMVFARGLINDIMLMFFPPAGQSIAAGRSRDGAWVCRYRTGDSSTVDVIVHEDDGWEIRQYDPDDRLTRCLETDLKGHKTIRDEAPVPIRLRLTAFGPAEYILTLNLIEARELGR